MIPRKAVGENPELGEEWPLATGDPKSKAENLTYGYAELS